MKGLLSKRFVILGKEVSALLLMLIALGGIASAALLTYYGIITGTVSVTQSLVISADGSTWKSCTGGNYSQCTLTYQQINIVGGDTQEFTGEGYKFYIKNNLPINWSWDYINFSWEYILPEDLLDGLSLLEVKWTTYQAGITPEPDCNMSTPISLNKTQHWICGGGTCKLTAPDKLGEGMIQKFCGVKIGMKPNAIPGTYAITINIVPR